MWEPSDGGMGTRSMSYQIRIFLQLFISWLSMRKVKPRCLHFCFEVTFMPSRTDDNDDDDDYDDSSKEKGAWVHI